MSKVQLRFKWTTCTADPRQYNQQRQIFEPVDLDVVVDLPLEEEYFYNFEGIKAGLDLNANPLPDPVLTPRGMVEAISLLETSFKSKESVEEQSEIFEEDLEEEFDNEEFVEEFSEEKDSFDEDDFSEEDEEIDLDADEEWDE